MNQATEQLNRFLDDGARAPEDDDQRAAVRVVAHLEPALDPDPAFLNTLERQLVAASRPRSNLIALPPAERIRGDAKPWRAEASSFSAAALLAVIVLGAALGGWLLLGHDRADPESSAVLPAAILSSSPASPTPVMVSTLANAVLYDEPSQSSTALMTFHPGTQLELISTNRTPSITWLQLRVPGTRIVGWGTAYSPFDPATGVFRPGPARPPTIISPAPPDVSGALARVSGTVAVWSKPGPGMTMIWTAIPSDRLTLTGERIDQLGAAWVHVENVARNEDGWISADFLFAVHPSEASPVMSPTAIVVVGEAGNGLGKGPYHLKIGDRAHVMQSLTVWSQLKAGGMEALWRLTPYDRITITGPFIDFNGATWAPIRTSGPTPREGWVLADFLLPIDPLTPFATLKHVPPS